jgi:hypothetical protein
MSCDKPILFVFVILPATIRSDIAHPIAAVMLRMLPGATVGVISKKYLSGLALRPAV